MQGVYSPILREEENAHYWDAEWTGVGPNTLGGKTWQLLFKPTRAYGTGQIEW